MGKENLQGRLNVGLRGSISRPWIRYGTGLLICVVGLLLAGCIPIGVRGSTMPYAASAPAVKAPDAETQY